LQGFPGFQLLNKKPAGTTALELVETGSAAVGAKFNLMALLALEGPVYVLLITDSRLRGVLRSFISHI